MSSTRNEESPPCRQEEPSHSEDLLGTVSIPNSTVTPIDGLGWGSSPIEVDLPEIGSELGRYRLEAVRGMGSGSVVFRAQHISLGIPVALKFLNRRHFSDRLALLEQLRLEAALLTRVQHRNLVRVWDFDDDFDYAYLATEYIEGPALGSAIQNQTRIEPRNAVRIILQVVDALEALWNYKVVHRDVKPDNILLAINGTVKLIDLGLATILGEEIPQLQVVGPSSGWVGTPSYMAPEQARTHARVDFRADIYSLGVTLFQAVTGELPFKAKKASQMVLLHIERPPPDPRSLCKQIGDPLAEVILQMMRKLPAERYQSYDELRSALLATLE